MDVSADPPAKAASTPHEITSLHDVILDYIHTQAFASTAKVLSQPRSGSPTSSAGDGEAMDVDGMSSGAAARADGGSKERVIDRDRLESIERRRAILNYILNGAILRAVEALNTHFPSVLAEPPASSTSVASNGGASTNGSSSASMSITTNGHPHPSHLIPSSFSNSSSAPWRPTFPSSSLLRLQPPAPSDHSLPVLAHSTHPSHISLNLHIQQFIESFRQLAPSSPSSPASSISSLTSSMHMSHPGTGTAGGVTLTHALTAAQGLHSEAKKLPPDVRAVYLQEIKDVGALFAYTDPETSILKGFLDQSRRIALAEQVNRAILRSEGRDPTSRLEDVARRTTAVYSLMAQRDIDPRPPWTAADGEGKEQLAMFWKSQTGREFRLADYVGASW